MQKNILLILPRLTIRKTCEKTFFPPLNLLFLTAVLEKAGFVVNIVDQRIKENYKELIKKFLDKNENENENKNKNTVFVGITSMTGNQILQGLDIAQFIRDIDPTIPLVWGGVHLTLLGRQSMEDPLVDIVVKGEGEITIVDLARALSEKKELGNVDGILFKKDGEIIETPKRSWVDMADVPMPAWEKVQDDISHYMFEGKLRLHTSRGCPHKCRFCYNRGYNAGHWSAKTAVQMRDEVEYLRNKFKINSFHFVDDNFMTNGKRVKDFCVELRNRDIKIDWGFSIRIDYIKEKTMKMLSEAGVNDFFLGVESGSQHILDMIEKRITPEKIVTGNEILKNFNIKARYSFMVNFPFETLDDVKDTVRLAGRLRDVNPNTDFNLCSYTPYPGTEMYEVIKKEFQFSVPETFREWGHFSFDESERFQRDTAKYTFENIHLMWALHFINSAKLPSYLHPVKKWASYRFKRASISFTPEFSILKLLGKIKSPF